MSIQFNCPHCRKPFRVGDNLASRTATCKHCNNQLMIPALPGQPAVAVVPGMGPGAALQPADLEALAAAALSEAPPEAAAAPEDTRTIDFPCPYCDVQIHLPIALAGKQSPCPECRQIVKVPLLEKEELKDWRNVSKDGPSLARRDPGPGAAGAWGTAISSAVVSEEALIEADALPEEREPLTWGQRIFRGVAVVAVLLLLGGGWALIRHSSVQSQEHQALHLALASLKDSGKSLSPEGDAEIQRAIGEYYARIDLAKKARDYFGQARAKLVSPRSAADSDTLLLDLALTQIVLAGDEAAYRANKRLRWDDVENDLRQTMQMIHTPEARLEAMREVSRQLIALGEAPRAVILSRRLNYGEDNFEAQAIVGLEFLQAGKTEGVENLAQTIVPTPGESGQKPLVPSLIALWLVLQKPDKAKALAPAPRDATDSSLDTLARAGYVEGWARQGRWQEAHDLALATRSPVVRFRCLTVLAAAAADAQQGDTTRRALQEAVEMVREGQVKGAPAWWLWRLVHLGIRAGETALVQPVAGFISAPHLRGRAQVEVLRAELKDKGGKVDVARAEEGLEKKSLAYALAKEAVLRATVRSSGKAVKSISSWEEPLRPFGYIGAALGLQDGER